MFSKKQNKIDGISFMVGVWLRVLILGLTMVATLSAQSSERKLMGSFCDQIAFELSHQFLKGRLSRKDFFEKDSECQIGYYDSDSTYIQVQANKHTTENEARRFFMDDSGTLTKLLDGAQLAQYEDSTRFWSSAKQFKRNKPDSVLFLRHRRYTVSFISVNWNLIKRVEKALRTADVFRK